MKMNRAFVWSFWISLVCLVLGYAWFFRFEVVEDRPVVPKSYKQFLLESVPGPRILIDSGSNAYHAVNGEMMESMTGYPVIILSDHAASSLQDKIARLRRYGHPGDYVILPLEWGGFYLSEDLSELHLRTSVDEVNYYYYSLPWYRRWIRAFWTPWSVAVERLFKGKLGQSDDYFTEVRRLERFGNHHLTRATYGGAVNQSGRAMEFYGEDCDDYILAGLNVDQPRPSDDFLNSLADLVELEKRGMHVVLVPPVVVGDHCYEKYGDRLDALLERVKPHLDRLGIHYRMDFLRYRFADEYFLNTHYHINDEARDRYTALIVGDLIESGWLQTAKDPVPPMKSRVGKWLEEKRRELMEQKLPLWRGNPTRVVDGDDRGQFYFADDWYAEESWGRWAAKKRSTLVFRPARPEQVFGIYLNARYFHGSEATRVYLNDVYVGEQDFSDNHLFELDKPMSYWMKGTNLVRLTFESGEIVSPKESTGEDDIRKLKFGLHSIELVDREHP